MQMRSVILAGLLSGLPLFVQDEPRQIFDSYFGKSRTAPASAPAQVKPEYRPAGGGRASSLKKTGSGSTRPAGNALGVTIWKMDAASGAGARLLVQTGKTSIEFTPHGMEAGEPLRQGDRVRLSIETP